MPLHGTNICIRLAIALTVPPNTNAYRAQRSSVLIHSYVFFNFLALSELVTKVRYLIARSLLSHFCILNDLIGIRISFFFSFCLISVTLVTVYVDE